MMLLINDHFFLGKYRIQPKSEINNGILFAPNFRGGFYDLVSFSMWKPNITFSCVFSILHCY